MQVKDIMSHNVESVSTEATLQEAARKMAGLDLGFLVVIDDQGPVGVVTDRDITVRGVAEGLDVVTVGVKEIMTHGVEIVCEDSSLKDACELMEEKQIRRLLVRGENERLVGVVSLGDVATADGTRELSGAVLERVSEPAATHA